MTLAMTRPWQHPKTGIFWLRKRVPKDLLLLVGKREEKLSLATRDPAEAKRRLVKALADVENRWAALRSAPTEPSRRIEAVVTTLSEREAHLRAEWMYSYWLARHRDNPSDQTFWPLDAYDLIWKQPSVEARSDAAAYALPNFDAKITMLEQWCFEQADLLLMARDMQVDVESRSKLAKSLTQKPTAARVAGCRTGWQRA